MKLIKTEQMEFAPVGQAGAVGCHICEIITDRDGAPTFAMRQFEVDPGGHTPLHTHGWEHEVFILQGEGEVRTEEGARPFSAGDAVFVPPDELHSFANTGEGPLRFLCLIPVQQACCR